jgi:hypothetical protein
MAPSWEKLFEPASITNRSRHDRREDARRTLGLARHAHPHLLHVVEHVGAGPDLRDAVRGRRGARRRRGAHADVLDRHAGVLASCLRVEQVGDDTRRHVADLGRRSRRVRVALVRDQSCDLDPGHLRHRRDELGGRRARRTSHPVLTGVDLHEHLDRLTPRHADESDPLRHLDRVERQADAGALQQRGEPLELRVADDRIGQEDVVEAGIGHDLRLPELRDGDAGRARRHLHGCDLGALVRLRVRPETNTAVACDRGHLLEVPFERLEMDHERRRVQLGVRVVEARARHAARLRRRGPATRRAR